MYGYVSVLKIVDAAIQMDGLAPCLCIETVVVLA